MKKLKLNKKVVATLSPKESIQLKGGFDRDTSIQLPPTDRRVCLDTDYQCIPRSYDCHPISIEFTKCNGCDINDISNDCTPIPKTLFCDIKLP